MRRVVVALLAASLALAGCSFGETSVTVQNDATSALVIRVQDASDSRSWLVPPLQESTIARTAISSRAKIELIDPDSCEILDQAEPLAGSFAIIILTTFPSTTLAVHAEDPPLEESLLEPSFDRC